MVTVEMDDWDWYADGYGILENDRVTVFGDLNKDLFDEQEISSETIIKLEADVGKGSANAM